MFKPETLMPVVDEVTQEYLAEDGYTSEQVDHGDFPPIMSLLSPELAAEVAAARVNDEPLYRPMLRTVRGTRFVRKSHVL